MFQLKALSKSSLTSHQPNLQTVIGRSAVVEGNLVSQELVHLKGRVVGNIRVTGGPNAQLKVLSHAEVDGDILAQEATVNGTFNGNIEATGRVELHASARVNGNISYSTMAIEHGAKLFGLMNPDAKTVP